jgi:hypothetical protein
LGHWNVDRVGPGTLPPMSVRQNPPKWASNPQCFPAQIRNIGQTVSLVTYVTSRVRSQSVTKYYNFLPNFSRRLHSALEQVHYKNTIRRRIDHALLIFPPGILIFGRFPNTSRTFGEEVNDNQCCSASSVSASLLKPVVVKGAFPNGIRLDLLEGECADVTSLGCGRILENLHSRLCHQFRVFVPSQVRQRK